MTSNDNDFAKANEAGRTMQQQSTGASPRLKASLGWASAVAVATIGLIGAMGLAPASAQEADPVTGSRITRGGDSIASRTLVLPEGKAAVIELPRAASDILVSDPNVVEAVIRTPRRVYLMGRSAGVANAFFFDSRDDQILNLEIRIEKDGSVIADMISRLLPTARINVETLADSIVLHGTADNAADAQRALEIAERFSSGGAGGETVMSMITVREPGQVMLKVRILEMQRSLARQLGVDLNGVVQLSADDVIGFSSISGTSGGLGGSISARTALGDADPINAAIDAFEQNGLVRTLAEPSLIAMSGEEAEFFAGGEVGFPVVQPGGLGGAALVTAEFRPFGVELKFQPTVRSKGSINLVLATSVSDVNRALGVGDIPGFLSRGTTTTIDLPSGTSFAIAGLLQENIQETIEGVPALKETPVLGQLFRSQNFERRETELVIIATPYLVEPTTLAELTEPGEDFVPPSALEGALLGKLEAANGIRARGVREARLSGPIGFILD